MVWDPQPVVFLHVMMQRMVYLLVMMQRTVKGELLWYLGNRHVSSVYAQGHAFEARLYAEAPERGFLPATGTVVRWKPPPEAGEFDHKKTVRVDSGVQAGDAVGVHYDPMIAKLVTSGPNRGAALAALRRALSQLQARPNLDQQSNQRTCCWQMLSHALASFCHAFLYSFFTSSAKYVQAMGNTRAKDIMSLTLLCQLLAAWMHIKC